MFKYILLGVGFASALRMEPSDSSYTEALRTYPADSTYTESPEVCKLYADTALQLYGMQNESHAVWASTTPTTAGILLDAMVEAGANLGILAKMTDCDMGLFTSD